MSLLAGCNQHSLERLLSSILIQTTVFQLQSSAFNYTCTILLTKQRCNSRIFALGMQVCQSYPSAFQILVEFCMNSIKKPLFRNKAHQWTQAVHTLEMQAAQLLAL